MFCISLSGFSLLYAVNNNPFTEIRKISLEDNRYSESTLVSWRRVADFAGLDYDYQQNHLYWADSFSIYRYSLLGKGKQNILTLIKQFRYAVEPCYGRVIRLFRARTAIVK